MPSRAAARDGSFFDRRCFSGLGSKPWSQVGGRPASASSAPAPLLARRSSRSRRFASRRAARRSYTENIAVIAEHAVVRQFLAGSGTVVFGA